MMKNVMEAIDLRTTSGKKLEIEPPVKAPSKLAKTSADEDPRKTANGLFEVFLELLKQYLIYPYQISLLFLIICIIFYIPTLLTD